MCSSGGLLLPLLVSAACACFCCLCSCCCFCCYFCAADRRIPPLQCLTFQNVKNNITIDWNPLTSTNCHKFVSIPPKFHENTLLLTPPHHTSGFPHLLASILLGLATRICASLLLLLCEKHTIAAFDLPKCLCFCHFLLLLDPGFSCCVLFFLAVRVAFAAAFADCCCLWCCFCCCYFLLLQLSLLLLLILFVLLLLFFVVLLLLLLSQLLLLLLLLLLLVGAICAAVCAICFCL